jgi:hypothetical protein
MSLIGDSEHGQGCLGGTKSLSLGSSSAVRGSVAAGLSLAGFDVNPVCLDLLEGVSSTGTSTSSFFTGFGEGNFVCFLFNLWEVISCHILYQTGELICMRQFQVWPEAGPTFSPPNPMGTD